MKKIHLYLMSLASALLLSLPFYQDFTGLIALVALLPYFFVEHYFLEDKTQNRWIQIFGYSYIMLFTWNLITTWWIKNATFGGMTFAVILNAFFMTIPFILSYLIKRKYNYGLGSFALLFFWTGYEYMHLN
ncbi:MAG: hypothetical protein SNJ71_08225 [Bacteroidales bacterium]